MSIYKKQAIIDAFPAYTVFDRYPNKDGFVEITADDILGLAHPKGFYWTFRPGSAVSYALEYNQDPIAAVMHCKEHGFRPFSLEIRVETERDAKAVYHLFNHARNCVLFEDEDLPTKVRRFIEVQCPDADLYCSNGSEIVPGLKYKDYYK